MTIKIEMIPMKPRGEGSLLYVDGQLYKPQKSEKGLRGIIGMMFTRLIYKQDSCINHVIAHSRLSSEIPTKISDLALIDPFYYNDRHGNHLGKELPVNVLQNMRMVIGLITWLRSRRFKKGTRTRTCVICKNTQQGKIVGHANMSMTPIIHWPSNYCLNPDCFSHEIEKMINPGYKIPEEAPMDEIIPLRNGVREELNKLTQEMFDEQDK
jgi:hypothetical protein